MSIFQKGKHFWENIFFTFFQKFVTIKIFSVSRLKQLFQNL
jgi:hypothetical protein